MTEQINSLAQRLTMNREWRCEATCHICGDRKVFIQDYGDKLEAKYDTAKDLHERGWRIIRGLIHCNECAC